MSNHRKCCCDEDCPPCGACVGETPCTWLITFTGIVECIPGNCYPFAGGDSFRYSVFNVNHTFCLTQHESDPCLWQFTDTSNTYMERTEYYGTNDCTGIDITTTQGILISMHLGFGYVHIEFAGSAVFIGAIAVEDRQCVDEIIGDNQLITCEFGGPFKDGSFATTPGGC